MNIFITGGSGFIGSHLREHLIAAGHHVTATGTRDASAIAPNTAYTYIRADTTQAGPWQQAAADADVIVNLAGKTIFQRWTEGYKKQIHDSRVQTTRRIVEALPDPCRAVLISASAVGYYGDGGEAGLTETAGPGNDFLAGVSIQWEAGARRAEEKGARVALARFGVVLGRGGGALAGMLPAFKSFVGGPLGTGRQWFPWIHIQDLTAAIAFLIRRGDLGGVFNLCAPHPVRNKELAAALGKQLGRPARLAVPAFMLKATLGRELAAVLLAGQRVLPERLLASGFIFEYPRIDSALAQLLAG